MIENLPIYISMIFIATTVLTVFIFNWVIRNSTDVNTRSQSGKITFAVIVWLALQAFLALNHVYSQDTDSIPPKIFLFGVLPNILVVLGLFLTKKGRLFILNLPVDKLTYLHIVRIPVELVLLWLFMNKAIPKIMTFEGWNFDILMGLSAPIVIYYGFKQRKISPNGILVWNIIGIIMLAIIFVTALLSAPSPIQKLAFEQPNIGLLHFPFCWLPTFIVPVVIFAHLVSIQRIVKTDSF